MKPNLTVLTRLAAGASGALLLVACGQQAPGGPTDQEPRAGASVGSCAADGPEVTGATKVTDADLDGDGTPEQVSLTAPDAQGCASYLVAKVGGTVRGTALGDAVGEGENAWSAVTIPGRTGQIVVLRSSHPRGGFQDSLYGVADKTLGPVVGADKKPLALPFVATDTPGGYVGVSCAEGGFVVREAVAHDPIGVAPAYDVRQTVYTLDGLTATAGAPTEVADNVLPAQLPTAYPDLAQREAFRTGCS